MTKSEQATLEPLRDARQVDAVKEAISVFDLPSSDAWASLDALSSRTSFEDLEANLDGIFLRPDGSIEVVGVAYVNLSYGDKKDHYSMTDSYPAKIVGHFIDPTKFSVDSVEVDTSSFYE